DGDTSSDGVLLTQYDVLSVMHYKYTNCDAPGNLGDTGLSPLDRLGSEIAYPKSSQVGIAHGGLAFAGVWAVREDATLLPRWLAAGALPGVFSGMSWSVGATFRSSSLAISAGAVPLPRDVATTVDVSFRDPWDRLKQGESVVLASNAKHT